MQKMEWRTTLWDEIWAKRRRVAVQREMREGGKNRALWTTVCGVRAETTWHSGVRGQLCSGAGSERVRSTDSTEETVLSGLCLVRVKIPLAEWVVEQAPVRLTFLAGGSE